MPSTHEPRPLDVLRTPLHANGRPLQIAAGLLVAAVVAHLVLGDALGVHGAWAAVLAVAGLFALLVAVDAGRGDAGEQGAYDATVIVLAGFAIAAAVACLYLPMPWGALGAAAVLVALIVTLKFSAGS